MTAALREATSGADSFAEWKARWLLWVSSLAWVLIALMPGLAMAASAPGPSVNVGVTRHTWGLEDGLPDRVIQAIAQTPDGYLWLGTPHGLVRFDGAKFVSVRQDRASALHEFGVSCVLPARDGTLWVGSVGGGVTHLRSRDAIVYGTDRGLDALTVRALYQSGDATIWAGTDMGLYRLQQGRFSLVRALGAESVTTLNPDNHGGFWVAGVKLWHAEHGQFHAVALPSLNSVIRSLAVEQDGTVWIGALRGLFVRRRNGAAQRVSEVNADVRALCFDQSGRLLIGTIGAGVLLRMPDGKITRELGSHAADRRAVRVIASVQNGDVWVGTDVGLIRLRHTGMDFLQTSNTGDSDFGSVFLDRDDAVWMSAGSLSRYAKQKEETVTLSPLRNQPVRAVFRDADGAFWAGTVGDGAYRLVHGRVVAHVLHATAITGFLGAPDGALWIGTDHGIAMWSRGVLRSFSRNGPTGMGTVKAMALSRDGALWLATPSGLFQFKDGVYCRPAVAMRLSGYRIWSLYAEQNGALWVGAGTGLYFWQDQTLTHVDLAGSPFQSQAVVSILVDTQGRFLLAEPTTIFRIPRSDLEHALITSAAVGTSGIRTVHLPVVPERFPVGSETGAELYSEIPGLASTDRRGGAWYATSQGLLHIAAAPLRQVHVAPPLTIASVLVDGSAVPAGEPVVLPPLTHNVQIEATPILLSGAKGFRLRSRLFGFEDRWSELSAGASSSYGRLAPGNYVYKVEAYWPGEAAVSSTQIAVTQQSAVYQRGWFLAVCCCLALLLIGLGYRYRIHQVALQFQAVADERSRVAREIHDTLLQGCIGALSLLDALEISFEREREKAVSGQAHRWMTVVQCVQEQFRATIEEAREAIWNLRNTGHASSLDAALRDALERLTSRAAVYTSFRVEGNSVPLIPKVQHEILMSAREAIMNSVLHARAGTIGLDISFGTSNLLVRIADDGVGFDPEAHRSAASKHFGLSGMHDRLRKVRGTVTIASQPGHGTTVRLSLPLSLCRLRNDKEMHR